MIKNLNFIKSIGKESKKALENSDLLTFAKLMDDHWNYKKTDQTIYQIQK